MNKLLLRLIIVLIILMATPTAALAQDPEGTVAPSIEHQGEEPTATPVPPTATPTNTPVPPTATPVPPTATPTNTPIPPTGTPTPTPTVTPIWPTDTPTRFPTPTVTSTSVPSCKDGKEPNDQPGGGLALTMNQPITNLTLYPFGDVDFFMMWGKPGRHYQITTTTSQGVDTRVRVYDPTGQLIAENDDYQAGNPASQTSFQAPLEGWFIVSVDSRVPVDWECRQYGITAVDISAPTATPTRTAGPPPTATPPATAIPSEKMYDDYEPNYDFSTAANIGVGQTLNLNFNSWPAGSNEVDNDFFRLYVKVGEQLQIETGELAQGLDTNLILFREDGEIIKGNDDCKEGQRHSCVDWAPDYNGVAYVVTGPVGTIPESVAAGARAYSLVVKDTAGQPATPGTAGAGLLTPTPFGTPQLGLPWAVTPLPATPAYLVPTPVLPLGTPTPAVVVRPIAPTGLPTPTLPPLKMVTIGVTIYYDENNNRAPDASEGISGVSIRVLDSTNNGVLGQTFTSSQGYATMTITSIGKVRLSIPYLGYNEAINPPGKEVFIRLTPLRLPSLIP